MLDLAVAVPGQLGGLLDSLAGGAQRNDPVVGFGGEYGRHTCQLPWLVTHLGVVVRGGFLGFARSAGMFAFGEGVRDPGPGSASSETGQVSAASDDRSLCRMSREGPPDEGCPYGVSAGSTRRVSQAVLNSPCF